MKSRIWAILCIFFFLIAAGEGVMIYRLKKQLQMKDQPTGIFPRFPFDDSFFKNFQGQMPKLPPFPNLEEEDDESESPLVESFQFGSPKREETKDEVRYLFTIRGHEKASFDVTANGEMITIEGKDSSENGSPQGGEWHFRQSFSTPPDIDPKKFRIERKGSQLAVIFKKRESSSVPVPKAPRPQSKEDEDREYRFKYSPDGEN